MGNDKLYGGDGFDVASFSDKLSPVLVNLGKGNTPKAKIGFSEIDKLKGIEGVWGGLGSDKITGDGGDNALGGNSGSDLLKGKGGDDLLVGFWGQDALIGGKGSDTFLFDRIAASDKSLNWDLIKDFDAGKGHHRLRPEGLPALDAGGSRPTTLRCPRRLRRTGPGMSSTTRRMASVLRPQWRWLGLRLQDRRAEGRADDRRLRHLRRGRPEHLRSSAPARAVRISPRRPRERRSRKPWATSMP
jgi:hypothetical protein